MPYVLHAVYCLVFVNCRFVACRCDGLLLVGCYLLMIACSLFVVGCGLLVVCRGSLLVAYCALCAVRCSLVVIRVCVCGLFLLGVCCLLVLSY